MDIPFDNTVAELPIYIYFIEQQIELLSSLFVISTFLDGFAYNSYLYIYKQRKKTLFWWFLHWILYWESIWVIFTITLFGSKQIGEEYYVISSMLMNNNYLTEVSVLQYILGWYAMFGNPWSLVKVGIRCTIQRYQRKHKNEFLLQFKARIAYLLLCILVQQEWKEDKNGNKSDKFIV